MLASVAFVLFIGAPAYATYIINIEQFGDDVTATGSGSVPSIGSFMSIIESDTMNPGIGTDDGDTAVVIGRPGLAKYSMFFTGGVSSPFGFGSFSSLADYGYGSIVGFTYYSRYLGMIVPEDYVWGSDLELSLSTWFDTTLEEMGLAIGSYSFTLGYYNTEVFRVNVIGPETDMNTNASRDVLAPSTLSLFVVGLAGFGFRFFGRSK